MSKKTEIDLAQSDMAIKHNYEKLEETAHFLVRLDELEDLVANHADRGIYIDITKKRIGHLLNKMLEKPLDPTDTKNLVWHGEMRGRLMEQIEHANILQGIKVHRSLIDVARNKLKAAITNISARMAGKAKD